MAQGIQVHCTARGLALGSLWAAAPALLWGAWSEGQGMRQPREALASPRALAVSLCLFA